MYCRNCGKEIKDNDLYCPHCGSEVGLSNSYSAPMSDDTRQTLYLVAKIFLILNCVFLGIFIIPLLWVVPLTVATIGRMNRNERIGIALKIVDLLFVSLVAGICLLVANEVQ